MSSLCRSMSEFRIGTAGSEFLSLRILGRAKVDRDDWKINLVNVAVQIVVGGFSGLFAAKLSLGDLASLRDGLSRLYSFDLREMAFEPHLDPYNSQLVFKIEGDGLGNFTASGEAAAEPGNGLMFSLSFDQTEIPAMLNGLDSILLEYPFLDHAGI